jgi:hypothetical protein
MILLADVFEITGFLDVVNVFNRLDDLRWCLVIYVCHLLHDRRRFLYMMCVCYCFPNRRLFNIINHVSASSPP